MSWSLKQKVLFGCGGLVLGLITFFLSGPRLDLNYTPQPLNLPQDLDAYLAQAEAAYPDLKPGTEKKIIWHQQPGQQTPYSIVFLHGFSASRQEINPLPQKLAQTLGANLFFTRFRGHGRSGKAMLEGSVNAWLNDAQEALAIGKRLGKKVIVLGVSTGASTATWLAAQSDPALAAFVLFSPNYGLRNRWGQLLAWPWGGQLAEWILGPEREWKPINQAQAKYWTWKYPSQALLPMMGIVNLTQKLAWEKIQTPLLIIYSPKDTVVDTQQTETYFAQIGSTQKELWHYQDSKDPEQHILVGDIVSPGSTEMVLPKMLNFLAQADIQPLKSP